MRNYDAPQLLAEANALADAGDIPAAGRKIHECIRSFLLADLEYMNCSPDGADRLDTADLVVALSSEGHLDSLMHEIVVNVLIDAANAELGGLVIGSTFRKALSYCQIVLNAAPYLNISAESVSIRAESYCTALAAVLDRHGRHPAAEQVREAVKLIMLPGEYTERSPDDEAKEITRGMKLTTPA